ncbi:MAG: thermonuclease family protein, partial [Gemmatimonadetes bacterium]|nr:thermonuclease family protein [Gemmatimonadota bacterium]
AATQAMRKLVGRNPVRCDVSHRDRYGRAIAACFADGRDLQEELVRQGLALAYRRYSVRYVPDEDAARKEGIGLWSGSFVEPWRWRRQQRRR